MLAFQIQTQDALEAAVAAHDKGKLQEALRSDQAQVCLGDYSSFVLNLLSANCCNAM